MASINPWLGWTGQMDTSDTVPALTVGKGRQVGAGDVVLAGSGPGSLAPLNPGRKSWQLEEWPLPCLECSELGSLLGETALGVLVPVTMRGSRGSAQHTRDWISPGCGQRKLR